MTGLAPPTVAADSHTDIEALKRAFGCFPSGVVALCTSLDDGNPVGAAVSSFTAVSIDPLASVWISHTAETGPLNGPSPPTVSRGSRPANARSNQPSKEHHHD
jgi:Flavin reductase like domain